MSVRRALNELGVSGDALVKSVATIRMFVAAHNVPAIAGDRVNGEELGLLEEVADELEKCIEAFRREERAK